MGVPGGLALRILKAEMWRRIGKKKFRGIVKDCSMEMCGMRCAGGYGEN